jgi:Macrocin-O-methyltransferase (TylF)
MNTIFSEGRPHQDRKRYSMIDQTNRSAADNAYERGVEGYFDASLGTNMDKLRSFAKFVPRQIISTFLGKCALFDQILDVHGHIIEAGVYLGAGLMTWANLSAIYEPYNHVRRIVGFDTFAGIPSITDKDGDAQMIGRCAADAQTDLAECLRLYDLNRPIGHVPRVELVAGDATETIPAYIEQNKHLVVAMLYLDFGVYAPTKAAIENFLPRMIKGSIIAFDELDQPSCPGETMAVLDTVGLRGLRLRRFPYATAISYAVLE